MPGAFQYKKRADVMKCGEILTKGKLQELYEQGWKIIVYDKNGEPDVESIGTDKYKYLIKYLENENKILRVERID